MTNRSVAEFTPGSGMETLGWNDAGNGGRAQDREERTDDPACTELVTLLKIGRVSRVRTHAVTCARRNFRKEREENGEQPINSPGY